MKKNKRRIIIISNQARSGKDTLAEIFRDNFGLKFESSSMFAAKKFIYELLKIKYNYQTFKECYEDRFNKRTEWHDLICEYNKDQKDRLANEIFEVNDIYVGMRDPEELECTENELIIFVDAGDRVPIESKTSNKIEKKHGDIILLNDKSLSCFTTRAIKLGKALNF